MPSFSAYAVGTALLMTTAACAKSGSDTAADSAAPATSVTPLPDPAPAASVSAPAPENTPTRIADPKPASTAAPTTTRTSGGEWDSVTKPVYTIDEAGNVKPIKKNRP